MLEGIRALMSMSNLLSIEFVPLLSTKTAPSMNDVASMELIRLMSGLLGALLEGIWQKCPSELSGTYSDTWCKM